MKNITLAIEDKVLKEARAYAERHGTTVNALVRDHLAHLVRQDQLIEEARRGLVELMETSPARLGPDYKWNREEIYEERSFPRHEHPDLRRGREK